MFNQEQINMVHVARVMKCGAENNGAGTVVDDPKICSSTFPSFYAINQSTTKGTAVPRQDLLIVDEFCFG